MALLELVFTEDPLLMRLEALRLDESMFTEEAAKSVEEKMAAVMPKTKPELNQKMAEYNGVTVEGLIASPSYEALKSEYAEHVKKSLIKAISETLGVPEKTATAVLYCAMAPSR